MSNQLLLRRRASCISDKRPNYLKFKALEDGCTLSLNKVGNPTDHPTEYSLNKGTFMSYVFGTTINFDEGDTVEWRRAEGYESTGFSDNDSNYYKFDVTGNIRLSGFVTTLLSATSNITKIRERAFRLLFDTSTSLTGNINFPDGILIIGSRNFRSWNVIGNIIFPSSVTSIGEELCMNSKFTGTVELPPLLENIGNDSFRNCPNIRKVIIPSNIKWLGHRCFLNTALDTIICLPKNPPTYGQTALGGTSAKIYVPYSADHSILDAYKAAGGWSDYANNIFELDENGEIPS